MHSKFEILKSKNGFVVPLLTIVISLMIFVFSLLVLILVGLGMADIEQQVKAQVEEPTIVEISINSFLKLENTYPSDNNKMINLLSMYNNTHDGQPSGGIHQEIQNLMDVFFRDENMALKISGEQFEPSTGITGVVTSYATRKVAIPEGNFEHIYLRYIK